MKTSESIESLAAALAMAQGEFTAPPKSKTADVPMKSGGRYSYSYADLAEVIETIRPVMTKHGLSVSQLPSRTEQGFELVTRLMHKSGQWIEGSIPLPEGRSPQELGSLLTYYRRYALCGVTGVAADEDDDGKGAGKDTKPPSKPSAPSKPAVKPAVTPKVEQPNVTKPIAQTTKPGAGMTDKQRAMIWSRIKKLDYSDEQAKQFMQAHSGKEHSADWTREDFERVLAAIELLEARGDAWEPEDVQS